MKDEFLVTLLTSSGEKQCLQRFRNVVMSFNKVLRECDTETLVKTQCWNLRGACAKNNAEDVRGSLENSDLVICVIDPTATEVVREDVVQALDWVRESFQMSFFAVKERSMFIYVKETSVSGTGSKQAQRAVSFLETLYKKDYNPITYPSENAFALTLLYQLCNMVRSELWCCDFPKEKDFGLGDIFTPEGIASFGISFSDLPWVKNYKEYQNLSCEIDVLSHALKNNEDKYATALRIEHSDYILKAMEAEMLKAYCLLCRFFCRQNTPEMDQAISAFLSGDITLANKKLNTAQLVRRISAYRKNPAGLKSAGATYKMEFDYLLNCYLLKVRLLRIINPLDFTDAENQLYRDVLSLSQGLVTLVEQMGINDEAGGFFYMRSEFSQAKAQFESSVKMFEAFPREKQKKTSLLGINAYHFTAKCLEIELGDVKMVEGEALPRKTISALKAIRVLYRKSLSLMTPLLKRCPASYWPAFSSIYSDLYEFYIKTGQTARADKLSEETHQMVSKLDTQCQNVPEILSDSDLDKASADHQEGRYSKENKDNSKGDSKNKGIDFTKLMDKVECHIELEYGNLDRAQKRIPQGLGTYIKSLSKDPYKVEKDLFAWIDSEEELPDIFSILKWGTAEAQESKATNSPASNIETGTSQEKGTKNEKYQEEADSLEENPDPNWDIAQILIDQATIYSKKENYIQTVRCAAAAVESINLRLVKNPGLVQLMSKALDLLMTGYAGLKKMPEYLECKLHAFQQMLLEIEREKGKNFDLFIKLLYNCFLQLHEVKEAEVEKISHNIFLSLREFMVENYAQINPSKVLNMLKTMQYSYNHYIKVGGPELLQKIDSEIAQVDAIIKQSVSGDLFGSDC